MIFVGGPSGPSPPCPSLIALTVRLYVVVGWRSVTLYFTTPSTARFLDPDNSDTVIKISLISLPLSDLILIRYATIGPSPVSLAEFHFRQEITACCGPVSVTSRESSSLGKTWEKRRIYVS